MFVLIEGDNKAAFLKMANSKRITNVDLSAYYYKRQNTVNF